MGTIYSCPVRNRPLQIRLEIAVIANLLVYLQTIALAVGNNDAVGGRVELDRRRETEAPLRLKASDPAPRLRHVGVGIDSLLPPLGQNLGVADQVGDGLTFRVEDGNPVVAPIGDVDIAIGIDGNIGGMIEHARLRISDRFFDSRNVRPEHRHCIGAFRRLDLPILAELHQEFALGRELLHPMVLPVRDVDIAVLVEGDPPGLVELAIAAAGPAAFPDKLPVGGEDLQAIVAAVDSNDVAAFLYGQSSRAQQLAVAATRLAPLPQEFTAAVEYGDRVLPVIRDVDMVVVVDRDPEGPRALPVAFPVFAKVGKMFLFA